MKYNLLNIEDVERFNFDCQKFKDFGSSVELKKIQHNRTITQNKALHLYFEFIANSLNEQGLEYEWKGIKGMTMSCNYNGQIVKDFLWRPIQQQLYNKSSTTELNTQEINEIIDILSKAFAELGMSVIFPSYESWATSEIIKKYEAVR